MTIDKKNQKTVRTLAWASFLNDLGSDMIYPVWPLFLTSVLGANMAVLGVIDGISDAVVSVSQAVSGYLSDRMKKRKVFIWLGYLCSLVSRVGYAVAAVWPQIVPLRVLDRAGKMRGAPRDAIIADISTRGNRGANFGLLRMADNLGAVCGIIFCIVFLKDLGFRRLFLVAAVPSLIAVALILLNVKEGGAEARIYKGFNVRHLSGNFKVFLALSAVFALGNFSYSFLLMYAKAFGFATAAVPVFYLVFSVVATASSVPFGRLADRAGRRPVLLASYLLWAGVCAALLVARHLAGTTLAFVLFGLHKGAIETVQKAFVSELSSAEFRASTLGTFQMVVGLCALPANLLAGVLWERAGIAVPLAVSLALTALASLLLVFVKEEATEKII